MLIDVHGPAIVEAGSASQHRGSHVTIPCLQDIMRQSLNTYLSGSYPNFLQGGPSGSIPRGLDIVAQGNC